MSRHRGVASAGNVLSRWKCHLRRVALPPKQTNKPLRLRLCRASSNHETLPVPRGNQNAGTIKVVSDLDQAVTTSQRLRHASVSTTWHEYGTRRVPLWCQMTACTGPTNLRIEANHFFHSRFWRTATWTLHQKADQRVLAALAHYTPQLPSFLFNRRRLAPERPGWGGTSVLQSGWGKMRQSHWRGSTGEFEGRPSQHLPLYFHPSSVASTGTNLRC